MLYIQTSHDPLTHVEDAEEYRCALGSRVTVVVIPNSAHAVIAEQPAAAARGQAPPKPRSAARDPRICHSWI